MKQTNEKGLDLHKAIKGWLLALMTASMPLLPYAGSAAQMHFESANFAANTLIIAVARSDGTALAAILGDNYREQLPIDQISAEEMDRFFAAWSGYHTLVPTAGNTRLLAIGENGWTLPIPIVREAQGWRFDTVKGGELMRIRRIGRNELSAIQAVLAYRDAQMKYAAQDHDSDGVPEFAQPASRWAGPGRALRNRASRSIPRLCRHLNAWGRTCATSRALT